LHLSWIIFLVWVGIFSPLLCCSQIKLLVRKIEDSDMLRLNYVLLWLFASKILQLFSTFSILKYKRSKFVLSQNMQNLTKFIEMSIIMYHIKDVSFKKYIFVTYLMILIWYHNYYLFFL
jgi:hypothetical protein